MDAATSAQIWAAFGLLVLTVLGGLTTLAVWIFRRAPTWLETAISKRLAATDERLQVNTALTEAIYKQSNGTLAQARSDAQKYRSMAERLYKIYQELNHTEVPVPPGAETVSGKTLLDMAMNRHRTVVRDGDFDHLMSRLLDQDYP